MQGERNSTTTILINPPSPSSSSHCHHHHHHLHHPLHSQTCRGSYIFYLLLNPPMVFFDFGWLYWLYSITLFDHCMKIYYCVVVFPWMLKLVYWCCLFLSNVCDVLMLILWFLYVLKCWNSILDGGQPSLCNFSNLTNLAILAWNFYILKLTC